MKRAINLARVSTPRQAELYSLDYQLEQMRAYDAEMGLTVVAEFKDDMTGRKLERDGLEEACLMLERDAADVLVTWKFDRLHRNYVNSVVLRERIRKAGKEIHYAQTRQVSGKTARQRLPEDLQYIMAEIEADDISERTSQGKANKIKAGKWLGLYKPPFGYRPVGRGRDVRVEIDEEEAEIVRKIFEWYVYGDTDSCPLSTLDITERLTAWKIPSPADKIESHAHLKKRGYAEWSRGTINKIIRQSAYKGMFYHYRIKLQAGKHLPNPDRASWAGVPVPAIVSEELFDAAQRKMDQGKWLSARSAQTEYLLGRRISCECGYKMHAQNTNKTYRRKDGTEKRYHYYTYRCPGAWQKNRVNRCDMPKIPVKELDARVWEWVKEEIANPAILKRKLEEIQEEQKNEAGGLRERLEVLVEHKKTIETELKRIGGLYAMGMPESIVQGLISEQSHKLQLVTEEIGKLEHEQEKPLTLDTIDSLVAFSREFGEHLEAIADNFTAKRVVIDGLDVRVEVVRKNGEIWLNLTCILRPDVISLTLFSGS